MQRLSDEELIALLDGEMEPADATRAEAVLARDGAMRDRLDLLATSTAQVRSAFDRVLHEPIPDTLIAAARGLAAGQAPSSTQASPASNVVQMIARRPTGRSRWVPVALAASVCGLLIGAGGGYYGAIQELSSRRRPPRPPPRAICSTIWRGITSCCMARVPRRRQRMTFRATRPISANG